MSLTVVKFPAKAPIVWHESSLLISIKKFLDMDVGEPQLAEPALNDLFSVILQSYRAALLAMGNNSVTACPSVGSDLQHALARLERTLFSQLTVPLLKRTEAELEEHLRQWAGSSAEYFQIKTNEVKELLFLVAQTAQSMGERDHRYSANFGEITAKLRSIADLDDLGEVRSSLVKQATQLKSYVDKMTTENQDSVTRLQSELSTYETKLKALEQLAAQDSLTGIANRRSIENGIEWRLEHNSTFCVVILDLDRFKQVNDTYGHLAGDNLLVQFSHELRANIRASDLVGRWGGDEFIVVLEGSLDTAASQIERLQKWVMGEYTIPTDMGTEKNKDKKPAVVKYKVGCSLGLAQYEPGETMQQLIARADSAMYGHKRKSHGAGGD